MRKFGFDNYYGNTSDYGIHFLEFPTFEYGHENVKNVEIPGKAGTLTIRTGTYKDTVVTNKLEFEIDSLDEYDSKLCEIKEWLHKTEKLQYTDSEDKFYAVKKVEISDIKRVHGYYGNMKVIFTCEPSVYFEHGDREFSLSELSFNAFSTAHPIYKITGEGVCTLTVNEKSITANVGQNITIDTERMIAYREDGTLQNTAISGDYEDLYLRPGKNTITITDGFECKVIPRWRCL